MSFSRDVTEAEVARATLEELDAERRAASDADTWRHALTEEIVQFFAAEMGDAEARRAILQELAGLADPLPLLHDTVARIRAIDRLGKAGAVWAEMDRLNGR